MAFHVKQERIVFEPPAQCSPSLNFSLIAAAYLLM